MPTVKVLITVEIGDKLREGINLIVVILRLVGMTKLQYHLAILFGHLLSVTTYKQKGGQMTNM